MITLGTMWRTDYEERSTTTEKTKARLYLPRQDMIVIWARFVVWVLKADRYMIGMTKCKRIWVARINLFYSYREIRNFKVLSWDVT